MFWNGALVGDSVIPGAAAPAIKLEAKPRQSEHLMARLTGSAYALKYRGAGRIGAETETFTSSTGSKIARCKIREK